MRKLQSFPNERELCYRLTHTITSSETDMEARLRLGALVNLLIQAAIGSADRLGFGFGGIREQQLFWVLSRLTLEIDRPLGWHETIEIETWPKTTEGLLYLRDFLIRDENQEIIGRATSGWLAIELESKRPRKVSSENEIYFTALKDKHGLQPYPKSWDPLVRKPSPT
jgi:medium-chain acyl-[acyl-carrier-protein] hydrolase